MEPNRILKRAAIALTVIDAVVWLLLHTMAWNARADFDIMGVGWFLTNLRQMLAWTTYFLFLGITGYLWFLSFTLPDPPSALTD